MDINDLNPILDSLGQLPRADGSETIPSLEEGMDPDQIAGSGTKVSKGSGTRVSKGINSGT